MHAACSNHLPAPLILMRLMFQAASCDAAIDVNMMTISGVVNDLLDPVSEPGDASVDAVVVWTPAAFAPAHNTGQKPSTRRLLAHQGTTRVSLTETGDIKGPGREILMCLQGKMITLIDKAYASTLAFNTHL